MILECLALYAAYKVADKYNRNYDEIQEIKSRIEQLEIELYYDNSYNIRREIRELKYRLTELER